MARIKRTESARTIMQTPDGNKHTVITYQRQIECRDLNGTDWMDDGIEIQTTSGLHVNFDGTTYSLPERNGSILTKPPANS